MKRSLKFIGLTLLAILIIWLLWNDYNLRRENRDNSPHPLSSQVGNIQIKVKSIDADVGYQEKIINNEDFLGYTTDGGGQLIGSLKDGQIKKILEKIGLSYGVKTYEFYLWDNQLILVHEKEEVFPYNDSDGSLDQSRLELSFDGYYYFNQDKLIQKEIKGEKRYSDNNVDLERMLLTEMKRGIGLLSK